jgi:hypothetical protein
MSTLTLARAQLREIQRAINDARLSARRAVRSYRNVVIVATGALLAVAVGFPFAAAQITSGLVVIQADHSSSSDARSLIVSMASIELWGVLGSIIAATASLYRLRSSRSLERLQFAQLMLKLPAGALTALFGVVLLQSGILPPLKAVSNSQLAAYAVIFGFAQEAFTHFVDRRASDLLSKSEPFNKEDGI